jgi:uncharacterized tellurite resistance protein B-like protein
MSSIASLVPAGFSASPAETDVLLELAYLVTAVDGRLTDDELAAFALVAARLLGKESLDTKELDALLERFADNVDEEEIGARVKELAPSLSKAHHELAYTLSLGLAFVDHDPAKAEDRLHATLADALGVSRERRAALSGQLGLDSKKA